MTVTYIYGNTGIGKSRYVLEKYGYSNVCRITTYRKPMFYDNYKGQDVLCLDEYDNQIPLTKLNSITDGYPENMRCRYQDRQACYTKVYIISNLDLRQQYIYEQKNKPEVWKALLRRINKVIRFMPDGTRKEYETDDYINGADAWTELVDDIPSPFSNIHESEQLVLCNK
jgi:hypothetical protein